MKKALIAIILATIVGVGLRYIFPKELVIPKKETEHVDELLAETLNETAKDSVAVPQKIDTIKKEVKKQPLDTLKQPKTKPVQPPTATNVLANFFEKLNKLERTKKGQVRIAYFGDSMLDADMIVMQFRHYLQKRFGGQGVGFVPITSASASGRYSIKHSFSNNWRKQSFLKKHDTIFAFGVNGETFFVGDSLSQDKATVRFRKGSAYRELGLVRPKLWYGKRREYTNDSIEILPTSVVLRTDEGEKQLDISKNRLLNSVALPKIQKKFEIDVYDQATLPLYGVSFNSSTGVIVDNLAIRGNSGLTLTRLRTNLMRQFQKKFGYDLVILSYGTNVFNPSYERGYGWYGKRMQRVVAHLQNCFSGADFIIVSMADRAVKQEDEMQTPESLAGFIWTQKTIADKSKSAFYNLYGAMGGAGSMRDWAESEPPLANKDYTHFNSKGAEKVGRMFYNWLMSSYERYLKEKKKSEEKAEKEDLERGFSEQL